VKRNNPPAVLVLENGAVFKGFFFGHKADVSGEVCFNTSMTGYQEILTDPSYSGQIVTLTYPMIGNYGCNELYNQSAKIQASGLIVREYVDHPSNHMADLSLAQFLDEQKVTAIEGIDTRKLVLMLRNEGAQRGGIFAGEYDPSMLERVRAIPVMQGLDLVSVVTTRSPYLFGDQKKKYRVAVLDFGIKTGILANLEQSGFAVEVFPASVDADELIAKDFDCYFFSNGPGDPEPVRYAIETIQKLIAHGRPIFGICLGHQLIALAEGKETYKLKFGHRGGNQPVRNEKSGRVEITAQNHGFAVRDAQSETSRLAVSHLNLNDQTIEGFLDEERSIMSVQYHPEACPGPNDSRYLFDQFFQMTERYHSRKGASV